MNYTELVKRLRRIGTCAPGYEPLLSEAADAIEELQQPYWTSVKDVLPENGAEVLAWSSSGFAYVDWWIDGAWKVNELVDGKHEFVTHWMPLPPPPKEDEA